MARTTNKNSKRQLIFTRLDGLSHLKRAEAVEVIVDEFNTTIAYARTLYQTHRQLRSKDDNGDDGFVTIYKVRDTRSNVSVDPYMSSMVKNNPSQHEARSEQDAIALYKKDNARKSKLATLL